MFSSHNQLKCYYLQCWDWKNLFGHQHIHEIQKKSHKIEEYHHVTTAQLKVYLVTEGIMKHVENLQVLIIEILVPENMCVLRPLLVTPG